MIDMGNPAAEEKKYFIGVGGEQAGPFSENEIWAKVRAHEIPDTTPLWYEGLPDWQPLSQVAPFNGTPPPEPVVKKPTVRPKKKSGEDDGEPSAATFAEEGDTSPVFDKKAGIFSKRSFVEAYGKYLVIGCILSLFGGAVYYIFVAGDQLMETVQNVTQPKKPSPPPETRESKVSKALSELLLSPSASLQILEAAWKEKPDDETGKQAFSAMVDYYSTHAPAEAGRLLMADKKPLEALKFYLADPPNYEAAARAYSAAAEMETDAGKQRDQLMEEIKILIGPGNNRELALTKLQAFDKKYPGTPHPFKYYLKPSEQKIQDIFDRISFYFVQSLLSYLDTEFKQVKLVTRPKVEVRREPDGRYRISGSYQGDVVLNRDRLTDIKLVFWSVKEQWALVETNITDERTKASKATRQKLETTSLSADEMLTNLETTFRTQFPKSALHERPSEKREVSTEN